MARAAFGLVQCNVAFQAWASGQWLVGLAVKEGLSSLAPAPLPLKGQTVISAVLRAFLFTTSPEEVGTTLSDFLFNRRKSRTWDSEMGSGSYYRSGA